MIVRSLLLAAAVTAFGLAIDTPASAQQRAMRTMPNQFGRPPIYDLFQQNRGILPNYYQYYRPQQQLQRNLEIQNYQLQRQGTEIQSLRTETRNAMQAPEAIRATGGRGSGFRNYSHFYPGLSGNR